MENIRIGIVGIGNIGSVHAQSIAAGKVQSMTLSAVRDIDYDKLNWAKGKYPECVCFTDCKK